MATLIFRDAKTVINAVDLSSTVKEVRIDYRAELQDDTVMGDSTRSRKAGLKDWTITYTFLQDRATGLVDDTLFSLVGASAFINKVNPQNAAISFANPEYCGPGVLESYGPGGGAIGDLEQTTAVVLAAGDLKRATA